MKDLQLPEKKFVFMPINNNSDVRESGGTHWWDWSFPVCYSLRISQNTVDSSWEISCFLRSLLVYHRPNNTFYNLDSWNENNLRHSRALASAVGRALDVPSNPKFESIEVPQQHNGNLEFISITEATHKIFSFLTRLCFQGSTVECMWSAFQSFSAVNIYQDLRWIWPLSHPSTSPRSDNSSTIRFYIYEK